MSGIGRGAEEEVVLAVGRAVGGQVVELPDLALGQAHVAEVDHVHRQQDRRVLAGQHSSTRVSVATPATSWSWSHSIVRRQAGAGRPVAVLLADAQEVHVPGADHHDVARLDGHARWRPARRRGRRR